MLILVCWGTSLGEGKTGATIGIFGAKGPPPCKAATLAHPLGGQGNRHFYFFLVLVGTRMLWRRDGKEDLAGGARPGETTFFFFGLER